jgi:hypothetical protein
MNTGKNIIPEGGGHVSIKKVGFQKETDLGRPPCEYWRRRVPRWEWAGI